MSQRAVGGWSPPLLFDLHALTHTGPMQGAARAQPDPRVTQDLPPGVVANDDLVDGPLTSDMVRFCRLFQQICTRDEHAGAVCDALTAAPTCGVCILLLCAGLKAAAALRGCRPRKRKLASVRRQEPELAPWLGLLREPWEVRPGGAPVVCGAYVYTRQAGPSNHNAGAAHVLAGRNAVAGDSLQHT